MPTRYSVNPKKDLPVIDELKRRWQKEGLLQGKLGKLFLAAFGDRPLHIQIAYLMNIQGESEQDARQQIDAWRAGAVCD